MALKGYYVLMSPSYVTDLSFRLMYLMAQLTFPVEFQIGVTNVMYIKKRTLQFCPKYVSLSV